MTYTIYDTDSTVTYSLGQVTDISVTMKSPGDVFAMYGITSDENWVYDTDGVTRRFTLQGSYTTSDGTIDTFIDNIEGLLDAVQGDGSGYQLRTDSGDVPASADICVHLEEFQYKWKGGRPNDLVYSMKMVERTSSQ